MRLMLAKLPKQGRVVLPLRRQSSGPSQCRHAKREQTSNHSHRHGASVHKSRQACETCGLGSRGQQSAVARAPMHAAKVPARVNEQAPPSAWQGRGPPAAALAATPRAARAQSVPRQPSIPGRPRYIVRRVEAGSARRGSACGHRNPE